MKAALETNGWTPESRVTVLADGADGLNNLVCTATEKRTRKILDWFHISMRLRPIEQMSRGMAVVADRAQDVVLKELFEKKPPKVRHQMWNGQWYAALDRMGDLYRASARLLNSAPPSDAERSRRFREHLVNLRDYLCRNWSGLTNYARDHRHGMRISSAPAESAMSHLVNQRMGKRQQCAGLLKALIYFCKCDAPFWTTGSSRYSGKSIRTFAEQPPFHHCL
jgi:hypothetical protein